MVFANVLSRSATAAIRRPATMGAPRIAAAAFSTSPLAKSGPAPPIIQGEGAKPGTVPTEMEQATGLERFELLERLKGNDPFDMEPMQMTRYGTLEDPVKIWSINEWRIVGCTGYPADSHDNLYFKVWKDKAVRCPECGCAYTLDFQGEEHSHEHH